MASYISSQYKCQNVIFNHCHAHVAWRCSLYKWAFPHSKPRTGLANWLDIAS
jgi:hypothetical protein